MCGVLDFFLWYYALMDGVTVTVSRLLLGLKFNPRLKGFRILRDAVGIAAHFPHGIYSLKRDVYPILSAKYGMPPACLERNMANAVDAAFLNADIDEAERLFGNTISEKSGKPTLKGLIATLIRHILVYEIPPEEKRARV
jgi:hypothetical protein